MASCLPLSMVMKRPLSAAAAAAAAAAAGRHLRIARLRLRAEHPYCTVQCARLETFFFEGLSARQARQKAAGCFETLNSKAFLVLSAYN